MNSLIKILIAEHDPTDIELLQEELKKGAINYVSQVVHTEDDYRHSIKNFSPDIILADYTFPSFDGPTAFKIREKKAPDTPFIFVSGTIGEERSIELIRNGVTDYVLKDNLHSLNHKITRALTESKDKQQKKDIEQALIQSERLLSRAQQVAHMGNWELDFGSNTIQFSEEGCRIFGIAPCKKIQFQESSLGFIHDDDKALVIKKTEESRDLLQDHSIHYRIVHKDGSIRYIYSEGKLELDPNGKPSGLYGIVHDVTKMVLLEKQLALERHTKQSEITAAVLKAQENERKHLETELHENLNQILGVAKLYTELAKTDEKNRQMLLQKSVDFIVNVMNGIRKISRILGSPGEQLGLLNSIKNLLDDFANVNPIKIQFNENDIDETSLDEKLKLTIFRIVQEQMNNILKHAKASSAFISLSRVENEMILLISDNGEGTDFLKEIDGVGIKNIKSRTDLHNGMVLIDSKPGKGYELKVSLPLTGAITNPGRMRLNDINIVAGQDQAIPE